MTKPNAYEVITAQIVEAIEAGALTFTMPWNSKGRASGLPFNASTGNAYNGINILRLWVGESANGFSTNAWASYKQWQAKGCQVRKGEKGTPIVFFKPLEIERKGADGGPEKATIPLIRLSTVFNADQVEGYASPAALDTEEDKTARLRAADLFVGNAGADIRHGGDAAFYRPSADYIQMPNRSQFIGTDTSTATEAYYSTLLHELTHWTGNKRRLDRLEFKNSFGSEGYAFEELVAELGAAFLCQSLGVTVTPRQDHAAYIQSWLKVLKNDSRAIFKAAAQAQKAADYLHGLQAAKATQKAA